LPCTTNPYTRSLHDALPIYFCNMRWREYAGNDRNWLESVHPDELADVQNRWSEALRTREPLNIEARLCGFQGYRTFVVKANLIADRKSTRLNSSHLGISYAV